MTNATFALTREMTDSPRGRGPASPWSATRRFASDLRAGHEARAWARPVLLEHDQSSLLDDALVVLTELIVNAVQHGTGPVELRLAGTRMGGLRVEVDDSGGGTVATREPDLTGGRGLRLVDALTESWGVEPQAHGKMVWAVLGDRPGSSFR